MKLWIRWGSIFDPDFLLIKRKFIFTGEITPAELSLLLNEERTKWDENIIFQEEIKKPTDIITVVHYATEAPMPFIRPKDFVEKNIRFIKDSIYYGYCSSVPDYLLPPKQNYNRGNTIFAGSILKYEEKRNVYYSFSQAELKVFVSILV